MNAAYIANMFQVSHDFVAFMRMFLIFMIVGGVTIQAILYPHWPVGLEMFKRVFTRPLYALFMTQIDDLSGRIKFEYINPLVID